MSASYQEKLEKLRAEFAERIAAASSDVSAFDGVGIPPVVVLPWASRRSTPSAFPAAKLTESFSVSISYDGEPLFPGAPDAVVICARDVEALGYDSLVRVTLHIKSPDALPGRNTRGEREKLIAVALAAALENFLSIIDRG